MTDSETDGHANRRTNMEHSRAAEDVQFDLENLSSPVAQRLIGALNDELTLRYPEEGANHFRLDPDEVAPGKGVFLVGRLNGEPIACGAVRCEGTQAEIKRMYVAPRLRGCGVARKLLAILEAEAVRLGACRLVLETGERQPESLALYERAGFVRIERFGEYVDSPHSVCMGKEIEPTR